MKVVLGRIAAACAAMVVAGVASLVPISHAFACSCAVRYTEDQALAEADVAFDGVVVSRENPLIVSSSADPVTYRFHVESGLKGPVPREVSLTTAESGASCGVAFQVGERWRVFAYGDINRLQTHLCAGNRLLDAHAPIPPAGGGMLVPILASLAAIAVLMVMAAFVVRRAGRG